ncbi:MAG: acyl carrier protein [Deltaproteobacteria bacterium]|nr:acyl carrier protein [Kofleriaceae bacterium]
MSSATGTAKDRLRAWILEHGRRVDGVELTDDTPLLEKRILSSLQIADLLLFLEELRGAPVELEGLTGASFRDLGAMSRAFLAEAA